MVLLVLKYPISRNKVFYENDRFDRSFPHHELSIADNTVIVLNIDLDIFYFEEAAHNIK